MFYWVSREGLEPVCCKKWPLKNSSWPITGLGNKGPLKVVNGTKLILDDHGNNLDSFRISLESFRSPLLLKPVTGQVLFFAVSLQQTGSSIYGTEKDYTRRVWKIFQDFKTLWSYCAGKIHARLKKIYRVII